MKTLTLLLVLFVCFAKVAHAQYASFREAYQAGITSLEAKQPDAARKALTEALALGKTPTEKARAQHLIGVSYSDQGDYERGRTELAKALDLDASAATQAAIRTEIAQTFFVEKRWPEARQNFVKVADNNDAPEGVRALAQWWIAESYVEEGLEQREKKRSSVRSEARAISHRPRLFLLTSLQIPQKNSQQVRCFYCVSPTSPC
jgi:tetratricopeptide (TPR) repeat protein